MHPLTVGHLQRLPWIGPHAPFTSRLHSQPLQRMSAPCMGFKAVCWKRDLPMHGNTAELFESVKAHFHQLCINKDDCC